MPLGNDFTGRPAAAKEEKTGLDPEDKNKSVKGSTSGSTGLSKTAQKILRIQKQPAAPTLFLGNLGFEATQKSIRDLFEAHRGLKKIKEEDEAVKKDDAKVADKWIRKIRMGTFEDTGNCKGSVSSLPILNLFFTPIFSM
jgi:RNA recognition motif-containing protein